MNPIKINTGRVKRTREIEKAQPRNVTSKVSIGIFMAEKVPR